MLASNEGEHGEARRLRAVANSPKTPERKCPPFAETMRSEHPARRVSARVAIRLPNGFLRQPTGSGLAKQIFIE